MNTNRIARPSFPPRPRQMHKGEAGRVVVVAGSRDYTGAPRLVGLGALVVGAGLVRLLVPRSIRGEVACEDPALMISDVSETLQGCMAYPASRAVLAQAEESDAVILGPGLGQHPETRELARRLVRELPVPAVIDADALNALAGSELEECSGPRIFTPHPGEAARLLGIAAADVQQDREQAVQDLRALLGGVVVLKGYGTLIYDGTRVLANITGNAGLAVGGTGDVLAGMMGGFLAQGLAPIDAACCAVSIHGEAADLAVHEDTGQRALTPIDLLGALPAVMASCERPPQQRRGRRRR